MSTYLNISDKIKLETALTDSPEYNAILNYANTQGYSTPSESQITLQSSLLSSLKTIGVWDKLDTFAVFATDAGSDFALLDWKRIYTDAAVKEYTAVNAPTFTSNVGFQGDGTSAYIETNLNTDATASGLGVGRENNAAYGLRHTISSAYMAGFSNKQRSNITNGSGGNSGVYNQASIGYQPSETWSRPNESSKTFTRDSQGIYQYNDSEFLASPTGFDTRTDMGTAQILRGVQGIIYSNAQINAYWFSQYLTQQEVFDLHTAVNNYYTSL